jgi:hypothetical protein
MIDRVYQTVKMLANSEVRGNMKPADFDKALYKVMLEKYEEYPFELTKYINRQNRGLVGNGVQNVTAIIRAKMQHFLTSATLAFDNDKFTLPDNLVYLDTEAVFYNNSSKVSLCKDASEFNHLRQFKHTQPSIKYPIGFKIENTIEILPDTIQDKVKVYYLRKPLIPKWTYTVFQGVEMFNPDASDFQDIDMHPSEEDDIVDRLLVKLGINLKEQDLQVAGNNEDVQEENKKNTN